MNIPQTPKWFIYTAHLAAWLTCAYFLTINFTMPELMAEYVRKDQFEGGGLIENLTVFILFPGIILGLYAFIKYRKLMRPFWTAYWLLLWVFACIYFAGEEASWGQWYFNWETPESYSEINDQNETNLHNTSTWFDQKPRTLVEIWIFITGLILPAVYFFKQRRTAFNWQDWIHPVPSLISAAALFTLVRLTGWIDYKNIANLFGSSEFREFTIALFLTLYLISYYARLSRLAANANN